MALLLLLFIVLLAVASAAGFTADGTLPHQRGR
jgi:hypothetical protein